MRELASRTRTGDVVLFAATVAYAVANLGGITLAATGRIHPPWGVLSFFAFVSPLPCLVLLLTQFLIPAQRRRFSRTALAVALAGVLGLAYFTLRCLHAASAAV